MKIKAQTLEAPVFRKRLARCLRAVMSLMPSARAACLSLRPAASSLNISRSRGVQTTLSRKSSFF